MTIPDSSNSVELSESSAALENQVQPKKTGFFKQLVGKLSSIKTSAANKTNPTGNQLPDMREPGTHNPVLVVQRNDLQNNESPAQQTQAIPPKSLDFSDVKDAFENAIKPSLGESLSDFDEVIERSVENTSNSSSSPKKNLNTLAASFARGAFNQVSNNAMIGNSYSYDYIPAAMVKSDGSIDQPELEKFHIKFMDQLLTRLAGIDMKIDLNTQGMQHVGDTTKDLSFLQKSRLRHAGRNLVNRSSNLVNGLVLKQMRRTVLQQIRNASLRAGEGTFTATKAAMIQHYSQQTTKPNVEGIFANANPLATDLRTNNKNPLQSISLKKIQTKIVNTTPNIREAMMRASFKLQNPRQPLIKLGKIVEKPVEQGLFSKTVNAHKALYGLKVKSLNTHIGDAKKNLKITEALQAELKTLGTASNAAKENLQKAQDKVKGIPKKEISIEDKNNILEAKTKVRDLKFKQTLLELRTQRAEKAYTDSAKEVVRYTSPSNFEKTLAEQGFHTNNERGAPNKFLSGQAKLIDTFRGKLMHETHLLIAKKSAAKNDQKTPEQNSLKAQIKINAALIHAPKTPIQSLLKIITIFGENQITFTPPQAKIKVSQIKNELINLQYAHTDTAKARDKTLERVKTLSDQIDNLIKDSGLDETKQNEIRHLFSGTSLLAATSPETLSLEGLFDIPGTVSTKKSLELYQKQESVNTYRALFSKLNNAMATLLDPIKPQEPNAKEEAVATVQQEIISLMRSSETADEITDTYNTLVASLSRILGDPRTSTAQDSKTIRSREIRAMLPPPATSTGGLFLESIKTRAVEKMATDFVKLIECLGTNIEDSSMVELANIQPNQNNQATPTTVQELLKARALMSEDKTLEHMASLFEKIETTVSQAESSNETLSRMEYAAENINDQLKKMFNNGAEPDQKELEYSIKSLFSSFIDEMNTLPGVNIKPNGRVWNPLTNTNERSIQHHVKILSKAIQDLAKVKEDGRTLATTEGVRHTVFKYIQASFEHHFRRTDLDTASLRDRLLWGQNAPASMASSHLLATAMNDVRPNGEPKGIEDPDSILGTLQRDFSRTVNMPAQVITQGVVNAAIIGSAFGTVGAMAVGRPELLVLPLPLPFLNGGDWISMSFASTVAAIPLSILSVYKAVVNGRENNAASAQEFEKIAHDVARPRAEAKTDTIQPTRVSAYPKQLQTRNDATFALLKGIDSVLKWSNIKSKTNPQRPGYYLKSEPATAGSQAMQRIKKLDVFGGYDLSGKLAVSWQRQALRILDETRLDIGQNLLAPALLGLGTGAQLLGKIAKNDFGKTESPTSTILTADITTRVDDKQVFLANHLAKFQLEKSQPEEFKSLREC